MDRKSINPKRYLMVKKPNLSWEIEGEREEIKYREERNRIEVNEN